MTTATKRRPTLTPEERAERVEALNAELVAAVEALSTLEAWRKMLEVSARFTNYSLNNQLLLWTQAEQRGVTLTRVAAFGTWKKLGYRIMAGSKAFKIFEPVKSRLRQHEVEQWLADGRNPYDADNRPRMVLRGFKVGNVFDLAQVEATEDAQELPAGRQWIEQQGNGPEGLWDRLVAMTEAAGFTMELRPSIGSDGGAHGWTDYLRRIVWINTDCEEAERLRILAHEYAGHIRCDHETRNISRPQGEVEADSVAFVVLAALGLDISSSSVDYVAGWSEGKPELLREAAETVHRVAAAVLAEIEGAES